MFVIEGVEESRVETSVQSHGVTFGRRSGDTSNERLLHSIEGFHVSNLPLQRSLAGEAHGENREAIARDAVVWFLAHGTVRTRHFAERESKIGFTPLGWRIDLKCFDIS